jgi:hypothetical protein
MRFLSSFRSRWAAGASLSFLPLVLLPGCPQGDDDDAGLGDDDDTGLGDDDDTGIADDDDTGTGDDDDTGTGDDDDSLDLPSGISCEEEFCALSGVITESFTLTADTAWLLRGGVFIGDDVNETVLSIEPGTTIYGESATDGMLVIRRGSKLLAEGSAEAPIVFTSSKAPGSRASGDWGGLILNGRAPINSCGSEAAAEGPCEAFGEGGTGWYGGGDADDDSGVLRYVRVEFAGTLISPDNELNGIAFQAVGRGTTVDYVQVHMNADDGIEFFGGTVDFRHVVVTGVGDDSLDWTDGWQGRGQFFVGQQYPEMGDNGMEADNNAEDNAAAPRSGPRLSNVTLLGVPDSTASDIGMLLREGTGARLHNLVVAGFGESCVDIDHNETFANALDGDGELSGELTLSDSILDCAVSFDAEADGPVSVEAFVMELNSGNTLGDPGLVDAFDTAAPDFRAAEGGAAAAGGHVPEDAFFESVSFRGGVGSEDDWTAGWTRYDAN